MGCQAQSEFCGVLAGLTEEVGETSSFSWTAELRRLSPGVKPQYFCRQDPRGNQDAWFKMG
jgi:hypothetical protein